MTRSNLLSWQLSHCLVTRSHLMFWQLSNDKIILSLQLSNDKITFTVLTTVTWQDHTYSPDSCCRWTLVDIHISPRHGHMACHPHTGTPPYSLCHKILSCRLKYNTIIQNIIPICLKLRQAQGIKGWNAIEKMDNS